MPLHGLNMSNIAGWIGEAGSFARLLNDKSSDVNCFHHFKNGVVHVWIISKPWQYGFDRVGNSYIF